MGVLFRIFGDSGVPAVRARPSRWLRPSSGRLITPRAIVRNACRPKWFARARDIDRDRSATDLHRSPEAGPSGSMKSGSAWPLNC